MAIIGTSANNKSLETKTATIANGASLSDAIDIGAGELVGIGMPAAWTTAAITFQCSFDRGVTYNVVNDAAGSEVQVTSPAASKNILLAFAGIKGVTNLKLQSGTSATPVNQGAARSIILVIKEE